jgi:phosphoglycolate phosphatase
MPMLPIKLIIFDLDGTLVDSLDDLTTATNHMLVVLGRPPVGREQVRGMVGQGARNLVERALPGAPAPEVEQGLQLFLQFNADHIADQTRCYPGVRETLAVLAESALTLTIVSNKNEELCRKILAVMELDHYFAAIYGADSLPARKPSPEPLRHVMAEFGRRPGETLMVGDSINDIAAGLEAGVATVGCRFGYGAAVELQHATWQVASFSELLQLPPLQR